MNTDFARICLAGLAGALLLGGCATNALTEQPGDSQFGDANRHTMMAQVVNPDPVYDGPAASSGEHAAQAIERYRTDSVKEPETIRTTSGSAQGLPGGNR